MKKGMRFVLGFLGIICGSFIGFALMTPIADIWYRYSDGGGPDGMGKGIAAFFLCVLVAPVFGIIACVLNLKLKGRRQKIFIGVQMLLMVLIAAYLFSIFGHGPI
ncbi:MAG: hypothetical protein GY854_02485 [Deltaproteobacteria bacterium]|nr:hypothetical protein [Deltaproteobacteria bacterium]